MWTLFVLGCTTPTPAPPTLEPEVISPTPEEPAAPEALKEPSLDRYAASHILIAYHGAVDANTNRSEDQAQELAKKIRAQATPQNFADLAREYSDGPSNARGGRLGTYRTGTMVPDFERAVASVEPGEIGPLVKTPFGWHIIRRDAIEEIWLRHILIAYEGAVRTSVTRSKGEAQALAHDLRARLDHGGTFRALAREYSDDRSASSGGDLGVLTRGVMIPSFEEQAFSLKVGETSDVFDTAYGYHILKRTK